MITVYEDTRQQKGKHDRKHDWFVSNGIWVARTALHVGDYQLAGDGRIAVDTKEGIDELIKDVQVKVATKKAIAERITGLLGTFCAPERHHDKLFELIVGEDAGRNVSAEIVRYVYQNGLPEELIKPLEKLYTDRHGFFHRGLVRAQVEGVKLYVLVENVGGTIARTSVIQPNIDRLEDLHRWRNPRLFIMKGKKQKYPQAITGRRLQTACETMEQKYGCKFLFCRPEDSARMIVELLTGKTVVSM